MCPSRAVYRGSRRSLVLAFDIGTTYSGISYSVLDPGVVPQIKGVTRFPAGSDGDTSHVSKIPTIIYYDRDGNVKAVGAEAIHWQGKTYLDAKTGDWVKAEWFKIHLTSKAGTEGIPPLPPKKSIVQVFADFLVYLLKCSSTYLQDSNGIEWWESVHSQIKFVLSHPNGWEGAQQTILRQAAIMAGLIPDTSAGYSRLSFVTEGEASLHFAIHQGLPSDVTRNGEGVVIVDAGGGTIDISSYCKKIAGSTFEEAAAPQCNLNGSVFVTILAQIFINNFLQDSEFVADIEHITDCFDKTTKLRFRNSAEDQFTKFGGPRDNDPNCGIKFGQLRLLGADVAMFFQPSINCIVEAVLNQRRLSPKAISHVLLVGGFATSDWLFKKVREGLIPCGFSVTRPETPHLDKAVSDGALSFYIDHFVQQRVSKFTYGIFRSIRFDPALPDHQQRQGEIFKDISGKERLDGVFRVILPKHTNISETKEFKASFYQVANSKEDFREIFSVWSYRGALAEPKWKDVDAENYLKICTIDVDPSHLPLKPLSTPFGGGRYYKLEYEIVLLFGLTELKAWVAWKQKGVEKRSEAKIIYDLDPTNDD